MTLYHIEPVIVPPWTPEGQANHEDPQIAAFARIAETGYRIQWAENSSPSIDYFRRDKPDDFYPVAYPRSPLAKTYGALVFQLAEQIQSLKMDLAELKEDQWSDDAALMAEGLVQQWVRDGKTGTDERLALPELKKALAETLAGYTRKIEELKPEHAPLDFEKGFTFDLGGLAYNEEGHEDENPWGFEITYDDQGRGALVQFDGTFIHLPPGAHTVINVLTRYASAANIELSATKSDISEYATASTAPATENDKLNTELAAEKALRIAAEQGQIQSEKAQGYWYRRACFAEAALQPLADRHERRITLEARTHVKIAPTGRDEEELREELQIAHRTMAEARKEELPNYEDVIRNRRQRAFLAWAIRTFDHPGQGKPGDPDYKARVDAADPEERLFRFFEEAVEFVQAGCDQVAANEEAMADATLEDATAYTYLAVMDRLWNRLIRTAGKVWGKPVGKIPQEIGGVSVTLMAAAERFGVNVAEVERAEFARVLSIPKEEFQARHQKKVDNGY